MLSNSSTAPQLSPTLADHQQAIDQWSASLPSSDSLGRQSASPIEEIQVELTGTLLVISTLLSSIIFCTFVGNLFVIVAIFVDKNLQTTANQLVLSLACADLMVACLVMPLGAYNDIRQGWYLGERLCEFWTSADVLCCTASILNLLAIAVDRYWAVTNVDYIYKRTRKRVNLMVFSAWTFGLIVSLAPIFGWKDPDFARRVLVEHKCLVSQDVAYQIFATISTFYAPLVLLLALYWRIFQVARKRIRCKPGGKSNAASGCAGGVRTTSGMIKSNWSTKRRSEAQQKQHQSGLAPQVISHSAGGGNRMAIEGVEDEINLIQKNNKTNGGLEAIRGKSAGQGEAREVLPTMPVSCATGRGGNQLLSAARLLLKDENRPKEEESRRELGQFHQEKSRIGGCTVYGEQLPHNAARISLVHGKMPENGSAVDVGQEVQSNSSRDLQTCEQQRRHRLLVSGRQEDGDGAEAYNEGGRRARRRIPEFEDDSSAGEEELALCMTMKRASDNKNNELPAASRDAYRRATTAQFAVSDAHSNGSATALTELHSDGVRKNIHPLATTLHSKSSKQQQPLSMENQQQTQSPCAGSPLTNSLASNECQHCSCCCTYLNTSDEDDGGGDREEVFDYDCIGSRDSRGGARCTQDAREVCCASALENKQLCIGGASLGLASKNEERFEQAGSGLALERRKDTRVAYASERKQQRPTNRQQRQQQQDGRAVRDKQSVNRLLALSGRLGVIDRERACAASSHCIQDNVHSPTSQQCQRRRQHCGKANISSIYSLSSPPPSKNYCTSPSTSRSQSCEDGREFSGSPISTSSSASMLAAAAAAGIEPARTWLVPGSLGSLAALAERPSCSEGSRPAEPKQQASSSLVQLDTIQLSSLATVIGAVKASASGGGRAQPKAALSAEQNQSSDKLLLGRRAAQATPTPCGPPIGAEQARRPQVGREVVPSIEGKPMVIRAGCAGLDRQASGMNEVKTMGASDRAQHSAVVAWTNGPAPASRLSKHNPHQATTDSGGSASGLKALSIRRKFKALGQLVSFVQTSRQFNSSSTSSSAPNSQSGDDDHHHPKSNNNSSTNNDEDYEGDERSVLESNRSSGGCEHLKNRSPERSKIAFKLGNVDSGQCRKQHQLEMSSKATNCLSALVAPDQELGKGEPEGGGRQAKLASRDSFKRSEERTAHRSLRGSSSSSTAIKARVTITDGGRRRDNLDIKREKKAAKTLAIITGVFVCCWLPFFVNAILMPICGLACTPSDLILSILLWLGYLNSMLNPIIYTIFSPDFRRAFRRLLCLWERAGGYANSRSGKADRRACKLARLS